MCGINGFYFNYENEEETKKYLGIKEKMKVI